MECSIHGCIKPVFATGVCHNHYDIQRKAKAEKCSCTGCDLPIHSKGMCSKHYRAELSKKKPKCKVIGCGRSVHANDLCTTHHTRLRRHGHLDPTRRSDWGSMQSHELNNAYGWIKKQRGITHIDQEWLDDFWIFVRDVGNKPTKRHRLYLINKDIGYVKGNTFWKAPILDEVKAKNRSEYQKKYLQKMRKNYPDKFLNYQYKNKYGITLDEYNLMLSDQGKGCKICGSKETVTEKGIVRRLAVDHCHETGKVRGLLCGNCNKSLGGFKDSKELLLKAIDYLETSQ